MSNDPLVVEISRDDFADVYENITGLPYGEVDGALGIW